MEVILAARARRTDASDSQQLFQPALDVLHLWLLVEQRAGVGDLVARELLRLSRVAVFEPAIGIGYFYALNGVHYISPLRFWRTGSVLVSRLCAVILGGKSESCEQGDG